MAIQTMSIGAFVRREYDIETGMQKLVAHLERNKITYRIIGTALIILISGAVDGTVFADSGGIERSAQKIYKKILLVGKWVIIIKGGWETIVKTVAGDFDSAKRSFFSYLIVYVTLLGLPWALNQVDAVFNDMGE